MAMLTVDEVAEELKVHRDTVRRWGREGALSLLRLPGGGLRVTADEMARFVQRCQPGGEQGNGAQP